MKIAIRILLFAIVVVLGYLTVESVLAPIRYAEEVEKKEALVIEKLKIIREAQMAYLDENGRFTASFDTLVDFMHNGKMSVTIEYGSKDDSTTTFRRETVEIPVKDSLFKDVDIDNIRYVPLYDTLEFEMGANTIVKNNVTVPVFQVLDPKPFSKERQENNDPLKVGSLYEVNYKGNWVTKATDND